MEVGIREFRSELRQWLEAVKSGQELVITERGRPVARIVAANAASSLDELIDSGAIKKPKSSARRASAHHRFDAKEGVSELVKDQRR